MNTTIPYDPEAEAGALGCILQANGESGALLDQLAEADFHDLRHTTIFRALARLLVAGKEADTVSLHQSLKDANAVEFAGGFQYVAGLPDLTPSPANFPTYLETILDRAARRKMLADAEDMARRAQDLRQPIEVTAPETLLDRLHARRFDAAAVIQEPSPRFSISGNGICTPGNLTSITAGVKLGKSSFIGAMLSATMTNSGTADCLVVQSENQSGFAVLHFDTEQSVADHHAGIMRSARRAGLDKAKQASGVLSASRGTTGAGVGFGVVAICP